MITEKEYLSALQVVRDYISQQNKMVKQLSENHNKATIYWFLYDSDFNISIRLSNGIRSFIHCKFNNFPHEESWDKTYEYMKTNYIQDLNLKEFRKMRMIGYQSIRELSEYLEQIINQPKSKA